MADPIIRTPTRCMTTREPVQHYDPCCPHHLDALVVVAGYTVCTARYATLTMLTELLCTWIAVHAQELPRSAAGTVFHYLETIARGDRVGGV
jgi:hypothetical protein